MKKSILSFFILFIFMYLLRAQDISSSTRIPLKDALDRLTKKYDVSMSYTVDSTLLDSVVYSFNGSLKEHLKFILSQVDFEFERLDQESFLIKKSTYRKKTTSYYNLRGSVKDEDGYDVPFAHVYLENTTIGTYTDSLGNFSLVNIPSDREYVIVVSTIGFETFSLKISNREDPIKVYLKEAFNVLEPVEVTTGSYQLSEENDIDVYYLKKQQIDFTPNLIQDVFRTINAVPSVTNTDYNVKPLIRGGNFNETAIYLDGFELINPFHVEISGGVQGLFNTDYVEKIKILPGGFSPQYTDRLSGVIDLTTKSYVENNQLSFSLDLLNTIASAKISINDKLSYLGNFRRGYWDLLIDLDALGASLLFYDTWNKFIYRFSDKNLVEMSFLYGKDRFGYRNEEQDIEVLHYDSDFDKLYGWLNWKSYLGDRTFSRLTIGYQSLNEVSDFEFESSLSENNTDNSDFDMFSINEYMVHDIGNSSTLSYGIEYRYFTNNTLFNEIRYDVFESTSQVLIIDTVAVNASIDGHLYGVYADYTFESESGLSGKAGVRGSGQSYTSLFNFAPRVNLSYQWSDILSSGIGYGWFYQPDLFYDLRSELGQENLRDRAAKAIHYVANVTMNLKKTNVRLDLYFKDYESMFDDYRLLPTNRIESFKSFEKSFNATSANSRGVELSINHFYRNNTLNVNYVFGQNRMMNEVGLETNRDFDVTHSFSINSLWKLKNNLTISASMLIRSGFPYSQVESVDGISTKNDLNQAIFYQVNEKNTTRYPAYKTVDFKISKSWYGKKVKWEGSLNILNTFNSNNVRNFYYNGFLNQSNSLNINREENIFFPFFISPGIKLTFH